ncbi:glycosyl transferase [Desulfuromonas versatilis]|uniref:Glycosyl transferase n=1 Tax=Desulfuromonas versatilis TaxID=2802975 RepID=A0ABM8HTZ5_9BACT|nr:glycosyltransferase [Desulfuromonas versatilis]BCR05797.1 glycosyl transferase [Desulfuromonas versatilis]
MNKNKISIFLPSLYGGGAERVMVNLANGLIELGYQVDVVLAKKDGKFFNLLNSKIEIIDLRSKRTFLCLFGLIKYLKKDKPTALISGLDHANIICILAQKISRAGCRSIITLHANFQPTYDDETINNIVKIKQKAFDCFIGLIFPFANNIIAVSEGVKEFYQNKYKLPKNKMKVIYNPVIDNSLKEKAKEPLDHPWFSQEHTPIILCVGRLSAQKNFKDAIYAFCEVRKHIKAKLVFLGEGEERLSLEEIIGKCGYKEDIEMLGFVSNPYKYLSRSSVFLLSSLFEGLPTVIIEALSLGIPVVSTDCPSGPSEIIGQNKYCRIVPVGDIHGLANGILEVINKKILPEGLNGLNVYDVGYASRKYVEIINEEGGF